MLPGLGVFALRPGMDTTVLVSFLRDVVSHVADRASAREQPSFHTWQAYESAVVPTAQAQCATYSIVSEKADDGLARAAPLRETFVVVGWVRGDAHLQWVLKTGKYNFRMGNTPGSLHLSAQVVGASSDFLIRRR